MNTDAAKRDVQEELPFEIERVYYQGGKGFTFDPRLQRTYMPKKAADIARDFDADALGVITLSEHANGARIGLDGQHRVRAGELVEFDGYVAKVYRNLTEEQEARLFRQLNNTSKVGTLELYRIALIEKRPDELRLQKIVEHHGLTTQAGRENSFTAVKTALRILERKDGEEHLNWAFKVAIKAWGIAPESVHGLIVEGLAMVKARYKTMETDSFIKKLAARPGRAPGVLGDAKTLQRSLGGAVKVNVADVLVSTYNHGLRKYKLADWRTSDAMDKAAEKAAAAIEEVPAAREEAKVPMAQQAWTPAPGPRPRPPLNPNPTRGPQFSGRA
jgi:hypothetical protein